MWHAVMGNTYMAADHGSCGYNADVAQWVGLGGDFTGRFMQAGVENDHGTEYQAWVEWWYGRGENEGFAYEPVLYQGKEPYIVGPNQYIRLYVGYNYSLETYYVYFTNDHTGETELVSGKIGHQFYDGSSAEWIDEAPGSLPMLNFGEITWWNAATQNAANQVLPAAYYPLWKETAGSSPHSLTAKPGAIWNGENWSDYYYACR
jgi:Peptidase A4 family